MTRSLPVPYQPNVPPRADLSEPGLSDVIRWASDEFTRLAGALAAQSVAMTVSLSNQITIGAVPNFQKMFPVLVSASWDVPGGSWNVPTVGEYTIPQSGVYQINASMQVAPFGIGNKNYYAGIRMTSTPASGGPTIIEIDDGGSDDVPLGVTFNVSLPVLQSTVILVETTAVHENQVGLVDVVNYLSISRVTGS